MRRGTLALLLVVALVIGGFLTVQLIANGPDGLLPVRIQTLNPEASTAAATANQAIAFIIFALVATGSLVGGGFVLGFIVQYMDKQIARNKAEKAPSKK